MSFILGIVLLALLAALVAAVPLWRRERRSQAAMAAIFVAGLSAGTYLLVGRPDLGVEPPRAFAGQPADVVAMVERLAERLERSPDDPEGWAMLGQAYVLMGRYPEAVAAFSEALERTPEETPDLVASYAEARVLADPSSLEGEAGALFERVLARDAANPRGLWYGGLAAQLNGEDALALQRWQELMARDLPPEFRQVVEGRIASIDPAAIGALVRVAVDIDPALANAVSENAVLYVFLRPADESGHDGPPLAARRAAFFELPATFPLTKADLLRSDELPDGTYTVTARLSNDGDPVAGPGDIEGSARWNTAEPAAVEVVLDKLHGE